MNKTIISPKSDSNTFNLYLYLFTFTFQIKIGPQLSESSGSDPLFKLVKCIVGHFQEHDVQEQRRWTADEDETPEEEGTGLSSLSGGQVEDRPVPAVSPWTGFRGGIMKPNKWRVKDSIINPDVENSSRKPSLTHHYPQLIPIQWKCWPSSLLAELASPTTCSLVAGVVTSWTFTAPSEGEEATFRLFAETEPLRSRRRHKQTSWTALVLLLLLFLQ